VYGLLPQAVAIPPVLLEDQFNPGAPAPVSLTNLVKLGVPVSKAHAPNPPSGDLFRPNEHLNWYEFFDAEPIRYARLKNQFTTENKGAFWEVRDGRFLLVPATKDGVGATTLDQHWKCYEADSREPDVTVNLLDQFHLEADVVVGSGRYLCNPVQKTRPPQDPEPPPPLPEEHLACYDVPTSTCETTVCAVDSSCCNVGWGASCVVNALALCGNLCTLDPSSDCCNPTGALGCDGFPQNRDLRDQFDDYLGTVVDHPELLCVPSIKTLPEPGVLYSLGSGLMLLGWLDRRRNRKPAGSRRATARGKKVWIR